eukprot:5162149-Pleurochrysis_carterae.AAC.1
MYRAVICGRSAACLQTLFSAHHVACPVRTRAQPAIQASNDCHLAALHFCTGCCRLIPERIISRST